MAVAGERSFRIAESERGGEPLALVSPDTATCEDCLSELFDPADRRYRYPFVNCTNCGPRFTIVRDVPYDRPATTMAGFTMCDACRAEYDDPGDRRFHAQPNACPECGPAVRLADGSGATVRVPGEAIREAAAALRAGMILALKGLGGYHLACRGDDEAAVARLRERKHREDRPFALMAPDLEAARALVDLGDEEERLLGGRERPIVLAPRREGAQVAGAVAPRSRDLGVMLPYSPLHHLLLADCAATLVMTSGNVSDEPIAYRDDDALERLGALADLFLLHDRPIHMRTDDSVVRALPGRAPLILRRSRGYVPASLALPLEADQPVLACGAEQKSTFCVAKERHAWLSHHVGDLTNWETLRSFREGVEHFERLFAVEPRVVAHDLHPDYLSTRYALDREGVALVGVQHHHAHLAACLAEHGDPGPAVGAIFDGTGYGLDGTVWGGELLVGGLAGFERVGHLHPVHLPGGDHRRCASPGAWRAPGCSRHATARLRPCPARSPTASNPRAWSAVTRLARGGISSPVTSSMGRLFDAVAALCGVRATVSYEGQAAVELEAAADGAERGSYPVAVASGPDGLSLDPRAAVAAIDHDVSAGVPVAAVSARFHNGLAAATASACSRVAGQRGLDTAVLSGGVFGNRLLLDRTARLLEQAGLRVLVPERAPPNDGGVALGQAVVAAERCRQGLAAAGPPQ